MTLTLALTHLSSQLLEAWQLSLQTPVLSRPQHLLPGPPAFPGHPPLGYSGTRGSSIQHTQAGGGPCIKDCLPGGELDADNDRGSGWGERTHSVKTV